MPYAPTPAGVDDAPRLPDQREHWRAPARFGSVPVEEYPIGWDTHRQFQKHYPRVDLPTQIVDRVSFGNAAAEPNRLIWGDNLHVMRQIESNSIDLIYMDPPFFSGRQYNVLWGDANEIRSFTDIWEGGMTGYLVWLNARLYEAKRLLKPTGSIYLHCDWHASHYIKVEMDKIFGYENFRNEIVWNYKYGGRGKSAFGRKHDVIFFYARSASTPFHEKAVRVPHEPRSLEENFKKVDEDGRHYREGTWTSGKTYRYYADEGRTCDDAWMDINALHWTDRQRIGYPTQKPESLIERILRGSSLHGDMVADFVMGGGTTCAVAQKLGRRFIGCDQSRVAVAVTAERLKQQAATGEFGDSPPPDITIEHWGIYEADRLSHMPAGDFRRFILHCYGATRHVDPEGTGQIHGWRNNMPIWVGNPVLTERASHRDVSEFANAVSRTPQYQQDNLRDATMLAWGFDDSARDAADRFRQQERPIALNFVRIDQVRIDHPKFREHIVSTSTDRGDYSEFLKFVPPPVVAVGHKALGGRTMTFDAGDSQVMNTGAQIINVQWDFNYNGRTFKATEGFSFNRTRSKKPELKATFKFDRPGKFRVACKVQDSMGGESTWTGEVEVT